MDREVFRVACPVLLYKFRESSAYTVEREREGGREREGSYNRANKAQKNTCLKRERKGEWLALLDIYKTRSRLREFAFLIQAGRRVSSALNANVNAKEPRSELHAESTGIMGVSSLVVNSGLRACSSAARELTPLLAIMSRTV